MLNCSNNKYKTLSLIVIFSLFSTATWGKQFSSTIQNIDIKLNNSWYQLNADLVYKLSPTAKEALQKGIPLTWHLLVNVKQKGLFWDESVQAFEITCRIKKNTLLNLYQVTKVNKGKTEIFSTLKAALNFMSKVRSFQLLKKQSMQAGQHYFVAIKVLFNREALPIPLRPLSYFNSEWALSSPWVLWPLQN
ncbi:MAG: DUF4390 domain-containing protein [Methylococcales bacterium]|nr:DUF4390 domain-containing protein [Methylococcales bacterium]